MCHLDFKHMEILEILGVITFILAIISIYLGLLVIKKQKPLFYKETVKIIDISVINPITQSDPNLKITYGSEPISTLSSTYITFWNAGNLRINKDDIPKYTLNNQSKRGSKNLSFNYFKGEG